MTSFVLTGFSSTARTLASTETAFIGVGGALVVDTADAISGSGVNSLTILGALVNQNFSISRAAYDFDGSSTTLLIGSAGNVISQSNAIALSMSAQALVTNDGLISADETAVFAVSSDTGATVQVINNGTISAQGDGLLLSSGNQTTLLLNTGTIAGADFAVNMEHFTGSTGTATLVNSGTMIGINGGAYNGRTGIDNVTNTGLMSGLVSLGANDDIYDGTLGSVTGAVMGGSGDDILKGGSNGETFYGEAGLDVLYGYGGDDFLNGGADADILSGGNGNDMLEGSGGNDRLYGGAGDDELSGGAGDDILRGQAGADAFKFEVGNGIDRIRDWQDGVDLLDFSSFGLTANQVLTHANQVGNNVRFFGFGGGDLLIVEDEVVANITIDDLIV